MRPRPLTRRLGEIGALRQPGTGLRLQPIPRPFRRETTRVNLGPGSSDGRPSRFRQRRELLLGDDDWRGVGCTGVALGGGVALARGCDAGEVVAAEGVVGGGVGGDDEGGGLGEGVEGGRDQGADAGHQAGAGGDPYTAVFPV